MPKITRAANGLYFWYLFCQFVNIFNGFNFFLLFMNYKEDMNTTNLDTRKMKNKNYLQNEKSNTYYF